MAGIPGFRPRVCASAVLGRKVRWLTTLVYCLLHQGRTSGPGQNCEALEPLKSLQIDRLLSVLGIFWDGSEPLIPCTEIRPSSEEDLIPERLAHNRFARVPVLETASTANVDESIPRKPGLAPGAAYQPPGNFECDSQLRIRRVMLVWSTSLPRGIAAQGHEDRLQNQMGRAGSSLQALHQGRTASHKEGRTLRSLCSPSPPESQFLRQDSKEPPRSAVVLVRTFVVDPCKS